MNIATHHVAPEEIMALLDDELRGLESEAVAVHVGECAECAGVADQLRATSQSLAQWSVPEVPESLNEAVNTFAAKADSNRKSARPESYTRMNFLNWRLWAIGGAGAMATVFLIAAVVVSAIYREDHPAKESQMLSSLKEPAQNSLAIDGRTITDKNTRVAGAGGGQATSGSAVFAYLDAPAAPSAAKDHNGPINGRAQPAPAALAGLVDPSATNTAPPPPQPAAAPMIARTVSLTIQLNDVAAARPSLEAVLAHHHGYAAQLSVNAAENAPRSFQASLRIPAPELATAVAEIRSLGRVVTETQSGEEVTQQHADLVARLQNSRETEQRLRDLLAQRTGKIDDILQVEEEISRVRGEIESMEAEQKTLEHRVDFVTVDLQLVEEYKEQLNPQSASVSTRMHNAFIDGLRHASEALLGIVLFLEEFAPVILIWLVILGAPALIAWRRYRRVRGQI